MEALSEHEFFIEPQADFQEGSIPTNHIKFTVVPRSPRSDFDVQIIALHGIGYRNLEELLKIFPVPVVWIEYVKNAYTLPEVKYPLITTCKTNNSSEYPKLQYWSPVVSRTLWKEDWIGDKQIVMSTVGGYSKNPTFIPILEYLKERKIPLDMRTTSPRTIPFETWKSKFIHSRVLLELTMKPSSFTILEAMTIGMPVVAFPYSDAPLVVRNKIDGFSRWESKEELADLLEKFLNDYNFAKEWGARSKERGNELNSNKITKEIWNKAFADAINTFNKHSDNPFEFKPVEKKNIQICPVCKGNSFKTTVERKDLKTITEIRCTNCGYLKRIES
jgi:hypothetical protein